MVDIKNPLIITLFIYITAGLIILFAAFFTLNYVGAIQPADRLLTNVGFLTASSIIFGFCGSSFIRFSDKVLDLKQKASNLAKELCAIYSKIKDDKKFSSLVIFYCWKVDYYGGRGNCSSTGRAHQVIESAYQSIVKDFRGQFNIKKHIINMFQVFPLVTLSASILSSLLAFAEPIRDTSISLAIIFFILSIPLIVSGWYYSNKCINDFDDVLFNIRQQVIGGIYGIPPAGYETTESSMMRERILTGEEIELAF